MLGRMNGNPAEDELLEVSEVAAHLRVSEVTVYRWCREGQLPCLKICGSWRIRRGALRDFLRHAERSTTLVGQLRSFLRVPDNVLGIAQTRELMYRMDTAFFQVGEARGGTLVKFYGDHTRPSPDELRARLKGKGLKVARLEDEGRFRLVEESDPPGDRVENLQRVLAEEARNGHALWASFDWMQDVDLDKTLVRQEALTRFVGDRQVTVMTLLTEREADDWPPAVQRKAQTLHTSTVWISEAGLLTSRLTPLYED